MTYEIRSAKEDEMELLRDWPNNEKWIPGLYDYQAFKQIDPSGIFVGVLDGQIIALIGAVAYDENYGFIGFYIVKQKFRGKGFGYKIFQKALQHLSKCKSIGLDGVIEKQSYYEKLGFKADHTTTRHSIAGTAVLYENPKIKSVKDVSLDQIIEFDRRMFPGNRDNFLKLWTSRPESHAVVYSEEEKVQGYGVIRRSAASYRFGPLYADNGQIAEAIIRSLAGLVKKGQILYLDVPDVNKEAQKLMKEFESQESFRSVRMYYGAFPQIPAQNHIFGISSLECG